MLKRFNKTIKEKNNYITVVNFIYILSIFQATVKLTTIKFIKIILVMQ